MPVPEARRKYILEQYALRLVEMQTLAQERGGRCVASEYRGMRVRIEFECAKGHRFTQYPDVIVRGSWCVQCRRRPPERLIEMQEIAGTRGGVCLSKEYRPWNQTMKFRCGEGHEFELSSSMIRGGSWCPQCRLRGTTIESLNELAARHGGRCVSKQYRGSQQRLTWECKHGHRFRQLPGIVKHGRWSCPECREAARERDRD